MINAHNPTFVPEAEIILLSISHNRPEPTVQTEQWDKWRLM